MIIESLTRKNNYCGMVAYTPEHVYNAWKRGNNLRFYVISNDKITDATYHFPDVIYYFTARIENGEIQLVVDDVALTLYSHDELVNTVRCAFPEDWHDLITILETLLYVE